MGAGNYGGQGGGMPSYQQGPASKGGMYGPPPQQMPYQQMPAQRAASPFDGGKGGSRQAQMTPGPSQPARQMAPMQQPANPFEGNAEYQALMDYQKGLGPTEQLENQQRMAEDAARRMSQMYQPNPYMMGGIGGFRGMYGPPIQRQFGGFSPFQQQLQNMPVMFSGGGRV